MVQVVETTAAAPRLVSTVDKVTRQVRRRETGTTFLLGENGVTAVTAYYNNPKLTVGGFCASACIPKVRLCRGRSLYPES
jgi:hypothetical protein